MKLSLCVFVVAFVGLTGCNKKNYQTATVNSPSVKMNNTVVNAQAFRTKTYNTAFYPTVLDAAIGIAQPFLLQQGYLKLPGVSVSDTNLVYNGMYYHVSQQYWNPAKDPAKAYHQYTIKAVDYKEYNLDNLSEIWPKSCPNALYDTATNTFHAFIDCSGYGSRLLAAVGDGSTGKNAFIELGSTVKSQNVATFVAKGYSSQAYGFAAAFPTLKTTGSKGWTYISGNVDADGIDVYNHKKDKKVGTYNGVRKGGFANSLPGDVMAYGNGPGTKHTGHFMVIGDVPQLLDATGLRHYYPNVSNMEIDSVLGTYKIYAVRVFDDSGKEAHFDDSRHHISGIGHGTVLIATSPTDDAPLGFISKAAKEDTEIAIKLVSEKESTSIYALSVGRYK